MVTLKKDNKIVKIQNDKYIIDAYLSSGYVIVTNTEVKENNDDKRINVDNK